MWNLVIGYARTELEDCRAEIPYNSDDPSLILKISERLKILAFTLDKLEAVFQFPSNGKVF